jgi:hypothetical protein
MGMDGEHPVVVEEMQHNGVIHPMKVERRRRWVSISDFKEVRNRRLPRHCVLGRLLTVRVKEFNRSNSQHRYYRLEVGHRRLVGYRVPMDVEGGMREVHVGVRSP